MKRRKIYQTYDKFFPRINEIRNQKIMIQRMGKREKTMDNCFGIKLNIKNIAHTHAQSFG